MEMKLEEAVYCPRCGSSKVRWVLPQIWGVYDCQDCGYRGSVIIKNGEIASKIREKWLRIQQREPT